MTDVQLPAALEQALEDELGRLAGAEGFALPLARPRRRRGLLRLSRRQPDLRRPRRAYSMMYELGSEARPGRPKGKAG